MPFMSRCRDILASSLLFASTVVAQDFDATWVEEIYPGGEAPEGERWILCRVVDKFTSEPVPNAELLLIQEQDHAAGGPLQAWREVSDDDGFLSVRVDKGALEYQPWNWLCVRAPGYCQFMRMTWLGDEVIELTPSEVEVEREAPEGVEVDKVVDVASRFVVAGSGPWKFRMRRGEILIDIDADGVDVTVGRHFIRVDGPTLLRGLEPGMHKMFVSGKGRRSAIVDVEVPKTGSANVKMALPAEQ